MRLTTTERRILSDSEERVSSFEQREKPDDHLHWACEHCGLRKADEDDEHGLCGYCRGLVEEGWP